MSSVRIDNGLDKWENVKGSAGRESGKETWINYWSYYTGEKLPCECKAEGCHEQAVDGSHIVYHHNLNGPEYIVPLCHKHNEFPRGQFFCLKLGTPIVSANVAETKKEFGE